VGKAPAFQFYPADWLKDPAVQAASSATRGAWINLLCRMWEADERGKIVGTMDQIRKLAGCEDAEWDAVLTEIVELKIADIENIENVTPASRVTERSKKVTLINRRMHKRYLELKSHAERQHKYRGRHSGGVNDGKRDNEVTPISSSSSSSSNLLPPPEGESAERTTCPHEEILRLYHETCPTLPAVLQFTKTRQGYLRQRWREHPTVEFWARFWNRVAASDFLCARVAGRDGKPPFLADFEWCVKPGNFAKIVEGRYDNRAARAREGPDPQDPLWVKPKQPEAVA